MNILNGIAAGLGALLAGKWIFRWRTGYRPLRWGEAKEPNTMPRSLALTSWAKRLTWTLAMLSVLVPAYCWLSGWNARALYFWNEFRFEYFPNYISWLPHTYDRAETMQFFRNFAGFTLTFWSVRDFLLTKSAVDVAADPESKRRRIRVPARVRRLLWVVGVNAAALSLEALIRRVSDSPKLLFFQETTYNKSADAQFGPFPYRANGAQYLNLVWPVLLGFWTLEQRAVRRHARPPPTSLVVVLCRVNCRRPHFSLSRGARW
jgi:hypothetical protein